MFPPHPKGSYPMINFPLTFCPPLAPLSPPSRPLPPPLAPSRPLSPPAHVKICSDPLAPSRPPLAPWTPLSPPIPKPLVWTPLSPPIPKPLVWTPLSPPLATLSPPKMGGVQMRGFGGVQMNPRPIKNISHTAEKWHFSGYLRCFFASALHGPKLNDAEMPKSQGIFQTTALRPNLQLGMYELHELCLYNRSLGLGQCVSDSSKNHVQSLAHLERENL